MERSHTPSAPKGPHQIRTPVRHDSRSRHTGRTEGTHPTAGALLRQTLPAQRTSFRYCPGTHAGINRRPRQDFRPVRFFFLPVSRTRAHKFCRYLSSIDLPASWPRASCAYLSHILHCVPHLAFPHAPRRRVSIHLISVHSSAECFLPAHWTKPPFPFSRIASAGTLPLEASILYHTFTALSIRKCYKLSS